MLLKKEHEKEFYMMMIETKGKKLGYQLEAWKRIHIEFIYCNLYFNHESTTIESRYENSNHSHIFKLHN